MGGNYSVAIDLGGTIIKIGLILDSEIVRFTTISSDSVKGLSHMLPKMEHAIDSLLSEEGISSTDLVSIGLAFPGMVNPVECRVISTNDKYDDACDIDLCHWADSRRVLDAVHPCWCSGCSTDVESRTLPNNVCHFRR